MTINEDETNKNNKNESIDGSLYEDNPLLRSKKSIKDKIQGHENDTLAEQRLAAIKRAREMSSSTSEDSTEGASSPSSSTSDAHISPMTDTNRWVHLGPTSHPNGQTYSDARVEVSGRITSIVIDPNDPNTIYIGAAQGGIWKTTDTGKNWIPTSDNALSLAIGALAIDHNNPLILYAGTGESNFSGDSQYGLGLIKTIDGGNTWEAKGIDKSSIIDAPANMNGFLNSRFSRIVINPNNSTTIFVATIASDSNNIASGIYRSTDGGEKWKRMNTGLPSISTMGSTDIVLNPNNPDIAYAAFYGIGIYKTTNANANDPQWNKLTTGLPLGGFSRIVLGISKSSPNTIYALMANGNYIIDKFFKSTDGGSNWNRINFPNGNIGGQGFYNINIAVNPKDENVVYLSGISVWQAVYNPANNNWKFTDIGKRIHPDNHSFAFSPENHDIIYAGNDGGIYRSENAGKTWNDQINKGLCITQFEFMDVAATSTSGIKVLAGVQDNGTLIYDGSPTFYHSADGDGGYVCIDPNNSENMWHTYYQLSPEFSDQGGKFNSWQDISQSLWGNPSEFYPPLTLDRTNSSNTAIGGKILYIDHSKGTNNWPERIDLHLTAPNNVITTINYVKSDLIYVGTSDGHVYQLTKQNNNWRVKAIHANPFPTNRYLWDVYNLPDDEKKVVVPISGFGTGHVFRGDIEMDGSTTWTDISGIEEEGGRLPDNPANAIVVDGQDSNTIYLGMDVGIFRTSDGGKHWMRLGEGLPNVQIYDMRLHSGYMTVVTHGRGIWQLKIS
jgi:photosystem II stability/assembly factor-like uncharacterized protein